MSLLLPTLVSWLQFYGYPMLWISIFVASAGLPLPIGLVLLAAGAFAAMGNFDIVILGIITITASVLGDSAGYVIGRKAGSKVLIWLEKKQFRFLPPRTIKRSQEYMQRRGGWAVFLTRFLLTALAGTVNLVAGANLYSFRKFLIFDIPGNCIGTVISLATGYLFGAGWEAMGDVMTNISLFVVGLLLAIYLAYLIIQMTRKARNVKADYQKVDSKHIIANGMEK